MILPTSIQAANVLDGIADAVAIIRSPQSDNPEQDVSIEFDTGPHLPPEIYFDPVVSRLREFRDGTLEYKFKVRPRILFRLPVLTAAEAIKWRKLWNFHMAGYQIIMRPHNDNSLKIEWPVCPTPNTSFKLGYFFDRYIGHTCELSFTSIVAISAMNLETSAIEFKPSIW